MREMIESFLLGFMKFFAGQVVPFLEGYAQPLLVEYGIPGLLVAAVTYYLLGMARSLKGEVQLRFDNPLLQLGTVIHSQVLVTASQNICIKSIKLTVIGKTSQTMPGENGSRTVSTKVYQSSESHRLAANLCADSERSFPVTINLPSASLSAKNERKLRKAYRKKHVDFTIKVELQCTGLNLTAIRFINVKQAATARPDLRAEMDKQLST